MPKPERAPTPSEPEIGPPILKKKGPQHDVSHYLKYLAEQGAAPTEAEMRAVAPSAEAPEKSKIAKTPPPEFHDQSEFAGAEKPGKLSDIRKGAWDIAAAAAWKKELGQEAQEREVDTLFNTLASLHKPDVIEHTLWSLYNKAQQEKRGPLFLGQVNEVLDRLKKSSGDTFITTTQGVLRFLHANPEDVFTSTAPPLETHNASVNPTAETEEMPTVKQVDVAETPIEQQFFDKGDRGEVTDDEDDNPGGGMVGRLAGRH